jgi:hypothetical protein
MHPKKGFQRLPPAGGLRQMIRDPPTDDAWQRSPRPPSAYGLA